MTDVAPHGEYTSGWKKTKDTHPEFKCCMCGSNEIEFKDWESSCGGYEDTKYHCVNCNRTWWDTKALRELLMKGTEKRMPEIMEERERALMRAARQALPALLDRSDELDRVKAENVELRRQCSEAAYAHGFNDARAELATARDIATAIAALKPKEQIHDD